MDKELSEQLLKLDRVGVLTVFRQMEIAKWIWKLLDDGADARLISSMMNVGLEDFEKFKSGGLDFKLSHIAGIEAAHHHMLSLKRENNILNVEADK